MNTREGKVGEGREVEAFNSRTGAGIQHNTVGIYASIALKYKVVLPVLYLSSFNFLIIALHNTNRLLLHFSPHYIQLNALTTFHVITAFPPLPAQ